jgi:hypothetical protein
MRRYSDQLRLKGGTPLYLRVGVNTGEVVVRSIRKDDLHTDYVPVGHSTNLAARKVETSPQPLTPNTQEAEACFWKAIEVARQQQAKSLELRAAMSLARLWQQQGRHHEAYTTLSEIYHWFTEGFDTKDLQEAKTLLEELACREAEGVVSEW